MTSTEIRALRFRFQWSRRMMGQALGCSRGAVAMLERGLIHPRGAILGRLHALSTWTTPSAAPRLPIHVPQQEEHNGGSDYGQGQR